jgi:hypothetical protein
MELTVVQCNCCAHCAARRSLQAVEEEGTRMSKRWIADRNCQDVGDDGLEQTLDALCRGCGQAVSAYCLYTG